jgi:hypothetical protein
MKIKKTIERNQKEKICLILGEKKILERYTGKEYLVVWGDNDNFVNELIVPACDGLDSKYKTIFCGNLQQVFQFFSFAVETAQKVYRINNN